MQTFDLLKHVRGVDNNVVIWLFNIGVEKFWGTDISAVKSHNDECIVNHMEEMNFLLSKRQDFLILRKVPNVDFLEGLSKEGFELPTIVTPTFEDENLGISEIILKDQMLLERLKSISRKYQKVYFVPYGVSELEEKIAEKCGFELIGGPSEIAKKINNKIFARKASEELGFSIAEGRICSSLEEVKRNSESLLEKFDKIVIKYPAGASGKGLWVVDSEKRLNTTIQIIQRICTSTLKNK